MPESVLFVDDDPAVTDAMRTALRKRPYRVVTANSGAEALDTLASQQIGVIVSDENMPGMRGSELLKIVRQRYPEVVRVILTGEACMENVIEAINGAEIFRFLTKPCRPNDVDLCLAHAIEAKRRLVSQALASEEAKTQADLIAAFERGLEQLRMVFQPLVSLRSGRTVAFEALARTDEDSFDGPGDLLERAELLERTDELDRKVRSLVAERIPSAPDDCMIFVNLHPFSLADPELLADSNPLLPYASRVVLEVTERSSLDSGAATDEVIAQLREREFRIAVDDLGAGYAGLTSFAQLRPEFVKFDMELVQGVCRSPTRAKLLASMCQLSRELGIQTVSEGIEDEEQLDGIAQAGSDIVQGFHLAKPAREFVPFSMPPRVV